MLISTFERFYAICRIALTALLLFAVGCQTGPMAGVPIYNPFYKDDPELAARFGPSPEARLKAIRDSARGAGRKMIDEQKQLAQQMIDDYRRETDPVLRAELARSLGAFSAEATAAVEGLRAAQQDADARVRIAACEGWRRLGGEEAVRQLGGVLSSDMDGDVRIAAARALGEFPGPEAVRALAVGLDDSDPALQYRTILSLRGASGRDYGNDIAAWRQYVQQGDAFPPPNHSIAERIQRLFY